MQVIRKVNHLQDGRHEHRRIISSRLWPLVNLWNEYQRTGQWKMADIRSLITPEGMRSEFTMERTTKEEPC